MYDEIKDRTRDRRFRKHLAYHWTKLTTTVRTMLPAYIDITATHYPTNGTPTAALRLRFSEFSVQVTNEDRTRDLRFCKHVTYRWTKMITSVQWLLLAYVRED
ncbi:hypothetical protein TNCV_4131521 [Trichonephila clavipes]|nr:hypothetical protein TNCV_4131521 [Trichonephila clavipes]